jgi:hypothetical protein
MMLGVLDTPGAWVLWEGCHVGAHGFRWTATYSLLRARTEEIPTYAIVELRSFLTPVHHHRL